MNEIPKAVFTRSGSAARKEELTTMTLKDASARREEIMMTLKNASATKETDPETIKRNLASWERTYVASGDLREEITRMKEQPGKDILAHGGASFAQSLIGLGLVDEFKLLVHPVALGKGLPIFSALSKPLDLKLIESIAFKGGTIAHIYSAIK
jgi:riboflavin biosynthesis pyrimidine reductase